MPAKEVIIILHRDATATSVPDPVHVGKRAQEEVQWRCPQGSAIVQFQGPMGSPFESDTFYVPRGGSVCSGPPRGDAEPGSYKYAIIGSIPGDQRKYVGDPKVDVDN